MIEPVEFPYRPNIGKLLLGVFFFGSVAFYMGFTALANDRGLIINGIFRFDVYGATTFYWIMAALCTGFVLLGLTGIISSLMSSGVLRLTETSLYVPQGILMRVREIPLDGISQARLRQVRHIRFLEILGGNRKVVINQDRLPAGAFEHVCKVVAERVAVGQSGKPPGESNVVAERATVGQSKKRSVGSSVSQKKTFGRKQ